VKELHKKILPLLADLNRCKEQEKPRGGVCLDRENVQPNSVAPTASNETILERQRALVALPSWMNVPALPRKSKHQQPQRLATRPVRTRHMSSAGELAYDSGEEQWGGNAGPPRATVGTGAGRYSGALTSQGMRVSERGHSRSAPTTPLSSPRGAAGPGEHSSIPYMNATTSMAVAIPAIPAMSSLPRASPSGRESGRCLSVGAGVSDASAASQWWATAADVM